MYPGKTLTCDAEHQSGPAAVRQLQSVDLAAPRLVIQWQKQQIQSALYL